MHSFKGKTILVTGGSRGIGEAICLAFAKKEANVVLNYNKSADKANLVAEKIKELGGTPLVVQADVSDFQQSQALVQKALDEFGQIDVLINNSGITRDNLMLRMSEEDFDSVIQVNLQMILGLKNMDVESSFFVLFG